MTWPMCEYADVKDTRCVELPPCCGAKGGRQLIARRCLHESKSDEILYCLSAHVDGYANRFDCETWRMSSGVVLPRDDEIAMSGNVPSPLIVMVGGSVPDIQTAGELIQTVVIRVSSSTANLQQFMLQEEVGAVAWIFGQLQCDDSDGWLKIAFALEKPIRDAFWLVLADDGCRVGLCSFTWANQFIEWLVSQGIKMPTPDDFSRRMEIDPGSSSREGVRDELHAES